MFEKGRWVENSFFIVVFCYGIRLFRVGGVLGSFILLSGGSLFFFGGGMDEIFKEVMVLFVCL